MAVGAGLSTPLRFLSSLAPMGSCPPGDSPETPGSCPPVPTPSREAPAPSHDPPGGYPQLWAGCGARRHPAPGCSEADVLGEAEPFGRFPPWWCPSVLCPVPSQCDLRRLGWRSRAERGSPCPDPAPCREHGGTPRACSAAPGEGSEGPGQRRGHLRTLLLLISQIQPARNSA